MPVEQAMFELILEAPQTAVARSVAVLGAGFQQLECALEQLKSAICKLTRKARATRKRVIEKDLCFQPAFTRRSERRSILGHQLARLDLQYLACRLGKCFADSSQRDIR